ncbi:MAG: hypothetical protein AMJ46_06345 [Latescibacteria bacterium DG_63]|nr:MAG: hypothetical protein AMJ46_06345 [Latescibacteria bacterium DG_63]
MLGQLFLRRAAFVLLARLRAFNKRGHFPFSLPHLYLSLLRIQLPQHLKLLPRHLFRESSERCSLALVFF